MGNLVKTDYGSFLTRISSLLEQARRKTVRQVNTVIIHTYWEIGHLIVEEEQKCTNRAQYGKYLPQSLQGILLKDLARVLQRPI